LLVLNEKTDEDANKDEVIKLEAERIKDEVQERINNIKEKFKKNKEIKATPSMQIDIEDNKNEEEIKIEEERIEEIKIKAEKIKKEEEIKIEPERINNEKEKFKKNKQVINKCNVCSKNAKNQCSKCKKI